MRHAFGFFMLVSVFGVGQIRAEEHGLHPVLTVGPGIHARQSEEGSLAESLHLALEVGVCLKGQKKTWSGEVCAAAGFDSVLSVGAGVSALFLARFGDWGLGGGPLLYFDFVRHGIEGYGVGGALAVRRELDHGVDLTIKAGVAGEWPGMSMDEHGVASVLVLQAELGFDL